jgi:hypothetical protein
MPEKISGIDVYKKDVQVAIQQKANRLEEQKKQIHGHLTSMQPLMDRIKSNICLIGTDHYIDLEEIFKNIQLENPSEFQEKTDFNSFIKKLDQNTEDLKKNHSLIEETLQKASSIFDFDEKSILLETFIHNVSALSQMLEDFSHRIPVSTGNEENRLSQQDLEKSIDFVKEKAKSKVYDNIKKSIKTLKFNELCRSSRVKSERDRYVDVYGLFKDFQSENPIQNEADRIFFPLNFFSQDDFLQLRTALENGTNQKSRSTKIGYIINSIYFYRNNLNEDRDRLQRIFFTTKDLENLKSILQQVKPTLSGKLVEKESFVDFIESIEKVPATHLMALHRRQQRLDSFFAFAKSRHKALSPLGPIDLHQVNSTHYGFHDNEFSVWHSESEKSIKKFHNKESLETHGITNWIEGVHAEDAQLGLNKCEHEKFFLSSSFYNKSYLYIPVVVMLSLLIIISPALLIAGTSALVAIGAAKSVVFLSIILGSFALVGLTIGIIALISSFISQLSDMSWLKNKREGLVQLQYEVINKKLNENDHDNIKELQSNLNNFLQQQGALEDPGKSVLKEAYAHFKDDFLKRTLVFSPNLLLNQEEMIPMQFDDFLMLATQAQEKLNYVLKQEYNEQRTQSLLMTQLNSKPFIYEAEHKLNYAINPVFTVALALSVLKNFEEYLPKYRDSLDQEKSSQANVLGNKFSPPVLHSKGKEDAFLKNGYESKVNSKNPSKN